jgi:hypothetical protein
MHNSLKIIKTFTVFLFRSICFGHSCAHDFKTIVHLVGFLFIVVIADARNHEPEKLQIEFIAPDDERRAARNMLSVQ